MAALRSIDCCRAKVANNVDTILVVPKHPAENANALDKVSPVMSLLPANAMIVPLAPLSRPRTSKIVDTRRHRTRPLTISRTSVSRDGTMISIHVSRNFVSGNKSSRSCGGEGGGDCGDGSGDCGDGGGDGGTEFMYLNIYTVSQGNIIM